MSTAENIHRRRTRRCDGESGRLETFNRQIQLLGFSRKQRKAEEEQRQHQIADEELGCGHDPKATRYACARELVCVNDAERGK